MSTRRALQDIAANVEESMGVRSLELNPTLSPVPQGKDRTRRPDRRFGRIDINQVIPDPDQPRQEFSDEAIERLANSITERGQLSPIRVRWAEELGKWVIVFGERRWRATKHASLSTINCYFHESNPSKSEILEEQLIENCLREELQAIEQAKAFAKLMELNEWTAKMLAEVLRVHPSTVSRALSLLRLPDDIQDDVSTGNISPRSAYEISKLNSEKQQRELARRARAGQLPSKQASNAVRQRKGKKATPARNTRETIVTPEGWKVVVSANRRGTYEEIEHALRYALDEIQHRIRNGIGKI